MTTDFIPQKGHYRRLRANQVAEIIYDVTFIFTSRFLRKGDRTIDQMSRARRAYRQAQASPHPQSAQSTPSAPPQASPEPPKKF